MHSNSYITFLKIISEYRDSTKSELLFSFVTHNIFSRTVNNGIKS